MNEWIYHGRPISGTEEFLKGYRAFVYIIRNKETGRSYYGKKRLLFVSHKRKKGRKNRIKVVNRSDWLSYWGSSDKLKCDIEKFGTHNFSREILRFCRTLSESNYYELKFQMENDVLLKPHEYYNEYVGGRINRRQMGIK